MTFEFKNSKFTVTQRSVTKSRFIGRDVEEIREISEQLFAKVEVMRQDGIRMLCLRLNLMRHMDTGAVSEPSALVGLDPAGNKDCVIEMAIPKPEGCAKSLNLMIPKTNLEGEAQEAEPIEQATEEVKQQPTNKRHYTWEQWRSFSYDKRKELLHVRKLNKKRNQN